jgi:hypothetical protein
MSGVWGLSKETNESFSNEFSESSIFMKPNKI